MIVGGEMSIRRLTGRAPALEKQEGPGFAPALKRGEEALRIRCPQRATDQPRSAWASAASAG